MGRCGALVDRSRELGRCGLRGRAEGKADSGTRDSRKGWGKLGAIISSSVFFCHHLLSLLL